MYFKVLDCSVQHDSFDNWIYERGTPHLSSVPMQRIWLMSTDLINQCDQEQAEQLFRWELRNIPKIPFNFGNI